MNTKPSKYIVHPGTGTIIDIYDGCWFVDAEGLPDEVDLDEIASTEFADLPLSVPANDPQGVFDYLISDFRSDDENGHFSDLDSDLIEFARSLSNDQLAGVISYAMELFVESSDTWKAWRNSVKHALEFQSAVSFHNDEEPF